MLFGPTLGLGTTVQFVPSKCSISVSVAASAGGGTGVEKPTAHTSFGASASTPFNWFAPEPTLGVATTFQFVPSQCIARVPLSSFSGPLNPTAHASFVASAEAPKRNASPEREVVAVHAVPSQCSNRKNSCCSSSPSRLPIAQTSSAAVEVMANRLGTSPLANLGPGNTLHCLPFHCSITCPGLASPMFTVPAAQAKVGEISTTPSRLAVLLPSIRGA